MSSERPRRLGRYELLELLGHGAMGVVYKAHDAFLDRIVAVKTYRQDIPITEDLRRRFEREVRTSSKLNHPNVVVVYDGGLEQDVPYLAMEFIEGPTLAAEMNRRGKLPTGEALAMLEEIADGLAYAHARGVVHRDLKPANILLAGGRHPKIADFGVARLMSSQTAVTTTPVGTPSYMAPEQIEGKPVDARCDVFALAILTYELLTGRQPFAGEGLTAVLYQIMNVDPEPPSQLDPNLPKALDEVVARALAKDPTQRTRDVATFASELRKAFVREEPPPAAAPAAPTGLQAPLDAGDFQAFRELAPRREKSSILGPAIAVVILLVAVLAVVVHLRSSRREPVPAVEGTPVAMTTAPAPTEAPVVPTSPPPSPKPTERPTEPPRPEPTAIRMKPTLAPTVAPPPTAAPRPTVPPPTAPPRPRATTAPERPAEPTAAPVAVAPPAAAENPTIDVISDPPGAEVVVSGVVKGRTPLRISDLDPGRYDFEVRKEGYNSYKKTAELDSASDYTMKVVLPTTVNSLRILSQPPGVMVKVNGELKGRTPLTLGQLPSGHYDVTGALEGYPEQTIGVDLKNGDLQEVRFTFAPK
ncbi:MAG TPA: serine/threonine-protein kinase [Candidatus Binatia bacterium]|nr:serine/threonine-protein kinase [Candidatus Binatia bacterium]